MAINEERSYTEYNVEVPTMDFPIGFDILAGGIDVVAVTLNDVEPTTLGYTVTKVNSTTYRFAPAVPSGVVRLTRITDIDHMVHVFTEGAIFVSENMDSNFKQIRHSQQEVQDNLGTFSDRVDNLNSEFISTRDVVSDLITISADTVNTANNAFNTATAIAAKASTALSNSSTALNTANSIDAKATDALDNALAARLASTAALTTANAIDAKATQALTNSAAALSSATTALSTASTVDAKATQALTDSATALADAAGALKKSNNLSDVNSATLSRTNLGVYSKSEVDTKVDFIHYLPLAYPKSTPPSGYLALMGQSISQGTYPKLYELYGAWLPDLRAITVRGLDNGRGVDGGRTVMSYQDDAIRNITANLRAVDFRIGGSGADGAFYLDGSQTTYGHATWDYEIYNPTLRFDASRVVPTAHENRVKNIAFLYIVKAG